MRNNDTWQLDLNEYIRQGEPDQVAKTEAWQTAIGLQAVDGLQTSAYLLATAKEHIEGDIDITQAQKKIYSYYESRDIRTAIEAGTKEADIVASRITEILGERTFQLSPIEWKNIHKRLFEGVFEHAGQYREYNISKKEWILEGDTVLYVAHDMIEETLKYDFQTEKEFSYEGLSLTDAVKHMAKFTAGIWQIHPFLEGNTRATAVFIIKYMKAFGLNVNNEMFEKHSWYFRNALVRANYNNLEKGVHANLEYLEHFFDNLILETKYELKNRYLHIGFQRVNKNTPKYQNDTLSDTLKLSFKELAVIKHIEENPKITQLRLVELTGIPIATVKRIMAGLQEKGYLERLHGKRNGIWKVNR